MKIIIWDVDVVWVHFFNCHIQYSMLLISKARDKGIPAKTNVTL